MANFPHSPITILQSETDEQVLERYTFAWNLYDKLHVVRKGGFIDESLRFGLNLLSISPLKVSRELGAPVLASKVPLKSVIAKTLNDVRLRDLIRGVNSCAGKENCSDVVLAIDRRLKGDLSAVAQADEVVGKGGKYSSFKEIFGEPEVSTKIGTIREIIGNLRDGEIGIVAILQNGREDGHAFNLVKKNGIVYVLDGQGGYALPARDVLSTVIERFEKTRPVYFFNTTEKLQSPVP